MDDENDAVLSVERSHSYFRWNKLLFQFLVTIDEVDSKIFRCQIKESVNWDSLWDWNNCR